MRSVGAAMADSSPSRPLRRDAQQNLDRVLERASRVFAERGLGVALADIAAEAGVGVGTLYRRFPDKDELILAVYQEKMHAAVGKSEQASVASDPGAAFRWLIEAGAADFASDRGFRELVLGGLTESLGWARSGPPTALTAAIDRMNASVSGYLAVLIERAKVAGALRPDVEPTDVQLINAAVQAIVGFASDARPGIEQRMISMILEGLQPRTDVVATLPTPALTEEELGRAVRSTGRPRR
ncbi:TetR/AcrR family transcriptional regulator [Pseudonocardia sp. GCM10023141]|uniref:TetR/AcrR family transcriptional regulator n=1 Tax=Pseudonocardia sp. GCM10023141 TaxID=3252653 RepID=UPI003611BC3A